MLDMLLDDVVLVLRRREVEAGARDEATALDRVEVGIAERDEDVVLLEVGKGQ